jgi:CheY-like chemotaxis protein
MRESRQTILVVDDDMVDVMTIRRALKELHVTNRVDHAQHGEAALSWLEESPSNRPAIILLDLNMPVMNGIEFLQVVKQHASFKSIPVIMLTTSEEQKDKMRSFDLGVAGYMSKPVDYLHFVEMMRSIDMYWTISQLP